MNLDQYSLLLTLACTALLLALLISIFAYFCIPDTKKRIISVPYFTYIKLIGIFALLSTTGALIYQFIYETPICEYCWWQRIFMFPIDIVAIGSVMFKIKKNEMIIGALSTIGFLIASYHYYLHYQSVVLNMDVQTGCSLLGITPSCTDTPVVVFDFITIPLMAVVAFAAIMWLSFLATKTEKK